MAQKNRVFTKEFKLDAVRRMQAGESAAALARELNLRSKLLYSCSPTMAGVTC
jgi:transposase-like protein